MSFGWKKSPSTKQNFPPQNKQKQNYASGGGEGSGVGSGAGGAGGGGPGSGVGSGVGEIVGSGGEVFGVEIVPELIDFGKTNLANPVKRPIL